MLVHFLLIFNYVQDPSNTVLMCLNRTGDSHCPAGIFKNIISNVTKNEEAGHGPVRVPRGAHLYIKGWLPSI